MSYIPLDIVHYVFKFIDQYSSVETMICKGLKDRYHRDTRDILKRRNLLYYTYRRKDITNEIKKCCLCEHNFFYGRYFSVRIPCKSKSICYNLGLLARTMDAGFTLESNDDDKIISHMETLKPDEEMEGILACINICPGLIRQLGPNLLDNLLPTKLIQPSLDVINEWRGKDHIPKLFLSNDRALETILSCENREDNYVSSIITKDDQLDVFIDMIIKTKYAVEIFFCNGCFCNKWNIIYTILPRSYLLDGLKDYSRLIEENVKYGYIHGIECLYEISVKENDHELRDLIYNLIRIKMMKCKQSPLFFDEEGSELSEYLLVYFNEQEPELSDTYYVRYWREVSMNDPWTLKEWLQIGTKYFDRSDMLYELNNGKNALVEPGEDIDGYVIVENEDYILLLS